MSQRGVAVVGMSVLLPGAPGLGRYWSNLVDGVDAISEIPSGRLDPVFFEGQSQGPGRFYCKRGGFIDEYADFDPLAFGIMPVVVEAAEPDQMIALRVAAEALCDIGESVDRVDRRRIGVILGRGGYLTQAQAQLGEWVRTSEQVVASLKGLLPELSEAQLNTVREHFQQAIGARRPEAAIGIVPNLAASRIANRLDFAGPAYLVDAACASSLIAIEHAIHELESRRCDLVLAGGVHHCHDTTLWSVFTQLQAVSPSHQIRPLDRRADGLLIGEGTGIVALKRLEDAERDGDRIYAVVRGTGLASDGRHSALMNPSVSGQVAALERAWQAAELDPASLGLLEAHGTATPAGDEAELRTVRQFFGAYAGGARAGIGSVKSMIGHAMPAAGIAGFVKAALAVYHGILPPTLHCDDPHPLLQDTCFEPVTKATPWETAVGVRRVAAVNAFGFGGVNAHVVIESHGATRPGTRAARGPEQGGTEPAGALHTGGEEEAVWLFAAANTQELMAQLDAAIEAGGPAPLSDAPGPVRLAIAAPNPKRVAMARKAVERGRAWRGRSEIWFSPNGLLREGGKLAFLFPGIEAHAVPPLGDLAEHFDLPIPDSGSEDLEQQAYSIVEAARLLDRVLAQLGVAADVMAGHSIGEWSALVASEMVPPSEVDACVEALDRVRLEVPDVVYTAVGASAASVQHIVDEIDDVEISHDNCPHQAILVGHSAALAVARERLREQRVMSEELPFRSGFHSRFFAPFVSQYEPAIERTPLQAPRVPLWSSMTGLRYPDDPAGVRDQLRRFYIEPVRFRPLIENMYADGARVFVQLGIGSLSHFTGDTLRSQEHLAVSLLDPARSPLQQLRRGAAALFVEGAPIDLARMFPEQPPFEDPEMPEAGSLRAEVLRATRSRGSKLRLGSNLVRFSEPLDLGRPIRGSRSAGLATTDGRCAEGPLLAELDAMLNEAGDASREIAELFASRGSASGRAARSRSATPKARPAQTTPTGPETVSPTGSAPRVFREERTFSLADLPDMIDHCLYRQPEGWSDSSDLFPVIPMTAMFALMGQTAERLAPGSRVVGFEKIMALRWLPVEPAITLEIKARFVAADRCEVELGQYARCVVLLGDRYPDPPADELEPLDLESACPVDASNFYPERWMFHGPAYQGVQELGEIAANGMRGTLRALPAIGSLLDNAGQLMGFWVLVYTEVDRFAFPFRIDRIDFFGPDPTPGTSTECEVRIDELTESAVRARMDLRIGGKLWTRVQGWEDRRFETTERSWDVFMKPSVSMLAETREHPYVVVREHWRTSAGRELVMRRYLSAAERAEYWALTPNRQRDWLLERIALKDAVRHWHWRRGHGPIYPIEVSVRRASDGALELTGPTADALHGAVTYDRGVAFAVVSSGNHPQIEIQPLGEEEVAGAGLLAAEGAHGRLLRPGAAVETCGETPVLVAWHGAD